MSDTRETPQWDRNAALVELEFSFFSEANDTAWQSLVRDRGSNVIKVKAADWGAEFVALPSKTANISRFLTGFVHPVQDRPQKTHWTIALRPQANDPPAEVIATSERVGGYPGVLEMFGTHWPGSREAIVEFEVSYLLNKSPWLPPWKIKRPAALKTASPSR